MEEVTVIVIIFAPLLLAFLLRPKSLRRTCYLCREGECERHGVCPKCGTYQ